MIVLASLVVSTVAALPPQQVRPATVESTAVEKAAALQEPEARPSQAPEHLRGATAARRLAIAWLAEHQDEDGKWDSDAFAKHDTGAANQEGADPLWDDKWLDEKPRPRIVADGVKAWVDEGDPKNDVGVTGLALLALMADGNSTTKGPQQAQVVRGVQWLRSMQDPESGLIGEEIGHTFTYDHAIATFALARALGADSTDAVRAKAQRAVDYIASARNPYGAWRYDVPPNGDNDTSVTTWMLLALGAAERAGLKIDAQAFEGAASWLDEMTDPTTGRVGYTQVGSRSSRVPGVNERFSTENAETLTAAGLLSRLTIGQRPAEHPVMVDHVKLMLRATPKMAPNSVDDALWVFYGTRATSWLGGKPWQMWSETFVPSVVATQSKFGSAAGSWDPKNAWGYSMGRVGTTALMAWTLASLEGAPDDGAKQRTR